MPDPLAQGLSDKEKEQFAYAVRVLRKVNEKKLDPIQQVAAFNLIKDLPDHIQDLAIQKIEQGTTITRVGRRTDLKAKPENVGAVILKVTVAGSGFGVWKTERERQEFVPEKEDATGFGWDPIDVDVTCYRRDSDKGPELLFAGPGGAGTEGYTGVKAGMWDRGSNSIDNLVKEIPKQVAAEINKADPTKKKKIVLLLRAHSRGAVAANQAANFLKERYAGRGIEVELVMFDPVPGPGQSKEKRKTDVSEIDETTLIYSLNPGKGGALNGSFTPQRIYGAKRIILSQQVHGGGLSEGYVYQDRRYTGSAINSLPEGIYVDKNDTGESETPLEMVASLDQLKQAVDKADKATARKWERGTAKKGERERGRVAELRKVYEQTKEEVHEAEGDVHAMGTGDRMKVIDKVLKEFVGLT